MHISEKDCKAIQVLAQDVERLLRDAAMDDRFGALENAQWNRSIAGIKSELAFSIARGVACATPIPTRIQSALRMRNSSPVSADMTREVCIESFDALTSKALAYRENEKHARLAGNESHAAHWRCFAEEHERHALRFRPLEVVPDRRLELPA